MKHEWSEKEIIAIKASLEHWYENLMLLQLNHLSKNGYLSEDVYTFSDHCALCQLFYYNDETDDEDVTYACGSCPLKIIGECCYLDNSAWERQSNAFTYRKRYKAFINMINTLESLLE